MQWYAQHKPNSLFNSNTEHTGAERLRKDEEHAPPAAAHTARPQDLKFPSDGVALLCNGMLNRIHEELTGPINNDDSASC